MTDFFGFVTTDTDVGEAPHAEEAEMGYLGYLCYGIFVSIPSPLFFPSIAIAISRNVDRPTKSFHSIQYQITPLSPQNMHRLRHPNLLRLLPAALKRHFLGSPH